VAKARKRYRWLGPDEHEQIVTALAAGASVLELVECFDSSPMTIYRIRARARLERRRIAHSPHGCRLPSASGSAAGSPSARRTPRSRARLAAIARRSGARSVPRPASEAASARFRPSAGRTSARGARSPASSPARRACSPPSRPGSSGAGRRSRSPPGFCSTIPTTWSCGSATRRSTSRCFSRRAASCAAR